MSRTARIGILIIVIVTAVFGRLCVSEFSWFDDQGTIHHNPDMNPPTWNGFKFYWTSFGSHAPLGLYIPVTYTVWQGLAKISYLDQPDDTGIHLNPWIFHSANVLFHVISALAVFAILRLLIKKDWPAAAGALIFAIHPVQVEPVGWISGMKDVLYGMFSLLTIWQYLYYRINQKNIVYFISATLTLIVAMLCKPTAMITPLIVLILDVMLLRASLRKTIVRLLPWFGLSLLCMISAKLAQPATNVPVAPFWARPFIALDSLAFYMGKLALPIDLTVYYTRRPLWVLHTGRLWYTGVAPLALFVVVYFYRRKHPALLAGMFVFVSAVLPVLGLVPFMYQYFSGVADHYLYLAMLGPALACAYLISLLPTRTVAAIASIVLVTWGVLSFHQARLWHDDLTLWQHAVALRPTDASSWVNYGAAQSRMGNDAAGERDFRHAIELDFNCAMAHDNLAITLINKGHIPEAISEINKVLSIYELLPPEIRPRMDSLQNDLGLVLMSRREYAQAVEHFKNSLRSNPNYEPAKKNLQIAEQYLQAATSQPATTQSGS